MRILHLKEQQLQQNLFIVTINNYWFIKAANNAITMKVKTVTKQAWTGQVLTKKILTKKVVTKLLFYYRDKKYS